MPDGCMHNFVDVSNALFNHYRDNCPGYQPRKSPTRDINSLLDIEEKGFITE